MTDPRKAFLIDLVRLTALMRIAVFNEKRFTDIELSRQSGIGVVRIHQVLIIALTSDYRDDQLELLVSQMDSLVHPPENIRHIGDPIELAVATRVQFPPLPVLIALTGIDAFVFDSLLKMNQAHRIEYRIRKTFKTRVQEWLVQNFLGAETAIKGMDLGNTSEVTVVTSSIPASSSFPEPTAHGEGLTDQHAIDELSKRYNIHPKDIAIIGNL